MKDGYLEVDDPGATDGMTKKLDVWNEYHADTEPVECPECHGYGGWHLKLNAYGQGRHFDCACGNCHSWGYLKKGEEGYNHKYDRIKAKFQPVLEFRGHSRTGYAQNSGHVALKDDSLVNDPELQFALILCVDGWWRHNFGGHAEKLSQRSEEGYLMYNVTVYTD